MHSAAPSHAPPWLSVVVPTLDEARTLPVLLAALRDGLHCPYEIVVADGGSTDGTRQAAEDAGARVVACTGGRGPQLAAGAAQARAELLCFLHADALPTPAAIAVLRSLAALSHAADEHAAGRLAVPAGARAPSHPRPAFAFRLRIDAPRLVYRLVEWGTNLRSRWLGLPYGDQGLVVSRRAYREAGGYPPWPLMEDVALVSRLARTVGVRLLPADLLVSARRWERDGVLRRTLENWLLLLRYTLGTSPERLARRYRSRPAS